MKILKHTLGASLTIATILVTTISTTSTAMAAPSGLDCPFSVAVGRTITCSFTDSGSTILATTESNGNATVTNLSVEGTSGTITVKGISVGSITICVTDGAFQTCDEIEVIFEA